MEPVQQDHPWTIAKFLSNPAVTHDRCSHLCGHHGTQGWHFNTQCDWAVVSSSSTIFTENTAAKFPQNPALDGLALSWTMGSLSVSLGLTTHFQDSYHNEKQDFGTQSNFFCTAQPKKTKMKQNKKPDKPKPATLGSPGPHRLTRQAKPRRPRWQQHLEVQIPNLAVVPRHWPYCMLIYILPFRTNTMENSKLFRFDSKNQPGFWF